MCKAIRDIKKRERREGRQEKLVQNISLIMKNLNLSLEQAMDALEVEKENREECRKLLLLE